MSSRLLPNNSTVLERALASVLPSDLPVPLRELMNPQRCPVELLPYLAWAWSVDRWDERWSEGVKRKAIAAAFHIHQHKGTIAALRRVIEPLGYLIEVLEWWQSDPPGPPGTFRLRIGVLESGITDVMFEEVERLIDDAKPLTRHLVGMDISLETQGWMHIGSGHYDGDILTVYSYLPEVIEVAGLYGSPGHDHIIDSMSVYPWP
ncbi:phage tail protein I [Pseudomonas aeruginosa]|uniref:Phage tail protein I n=2 Tax=Pseudomonas aeruginosa group TaxID=136841 RepID=A0ABD7KAX8_PSEAI|nr:MULTISPECIES: phage tail protein I [Pseudomonas aeruginosa group]KFF36251.1 tail protein [Pseudomonas aeruginosa VRFPA01]ABR85128.1 tail protein I (GpI) [Pseudomonas aeruginosa PA7]KSC87520.1 phage tail protein I [Pseudomonas aeruginosa]KSD18229.1 phage tail protein I [Pseudomonas aeruginosa]KSG50924.1 phage tail protein I [Pseudomonas aeruginosa]